MAPWNRKPPEASSLAPMHTQVLPRSVCAIAIAMFFAGCSSVEPQHRSRNPGQPLLTGRTLFMDGSVEVSARLSSFSLHGPPTGENEGTGGEHRERPGRRSGEHEREEGPDAGFTIDKGPNVERVELADEDGKVRPPRWIGSASRQTIVITIRNMGSKPLEVHVEDVTSPIGNFVPIPDSMTLEPGALFTRPKTSCSFKICLQQ